MSRIYLALVAAVVALAVAVAPALAAPPKLVATVGPSFTITLTKGGKKVKSLKHGKYTIVVRDKSDIHNFHLKGPGLNKTTSVSFVGNKTWTVTLKAGTYKYVCDPHASAMKGSFKVTG
jgi:spore coat protein U-like protein